ncbi:hypothetical protein [Porcipelethomonas sp.]|uniref:hypothetical protein n=1 Tax=Porcipelethomonas sp. TaxID=2981675 RepID=UPI003EF23C1F
MTPNENTSLAASGAKQLARIPHEKINIQKLFHKVSVLDYAIMWFLSDKVKQTEENQKFYLKDLSQAAGMPITFITEMVRQLQEKGLVEWKHDGGGEMGTYIQFTSVGMQAVLEQSDILTDFHTNVIEQFGHERFLKLLSEMSALEEIMNREIEREEQTNE